MVIVTAPAPAVRRVREPLKTSIPILLDDQGCCRMVANAPSSDAAWLVLCDRPPADHHYLSARLTACSSRVSDAEAAVAKGLGYIGELPPGPLEPRLLERLTTLCLEELDALWSLDDAAHAAAIEPAWVEMTEGTSRVLAQEVSWLRVSRLFSRTIQQVAGLADIDEVWNRLGGIDCSAELEAGKVDAIRERCREVVRYAVGVRYGGTTA